MGQSLSGLWRQLFGSGNYKIVMVCDRSSVGAVWERGGALCWLGQMTTVPCWIWQDAGKPSWLGPPGHPVTQVGLDNAGKTTTLYHLHMGETVKTQPTIGSNVRSMVYAVMDACAPGESGLASEVLAAADNFPPRRYEPFRFPVPARRWNKSRWTP